MVCFSPVGYACGIWCIAHIPQANKHTISTFVNQTHIQCTRPRRKTVFFKTSLPAFSCAGRTKFKSIIYVP